MGAPSLKESFKMNFEIEVTLEKEQSLKKTFQRLFPMLLSICTKQVKKDSRVEKYGL
jgi:hypothetical protein